MYPPTKYVEATFRDKDMHWSTSFRLAYCTVLGGGSSHGPSRSVTVVTSAGLFGKNPLLGVLCKCTMGCDPSTDIFSCAL